MLLAEHFENSVFRRETARKNRKIILFFPKQSRERIVKKAVANWSIEQLIFRAVVSFGNQPSYALYEVSFNNTFQIYLRMFLLSRVASLFKRLPSEHIYYRSKRTFNLEISAWKNDFLNFPLFHKLLLFYYCVIIHIKYELSCDKQYRISCQ